MAIKIRCTECTKKISIDEAFAGGACRCPYCKAIVMVPGAGGSAVAGARPDAPRPEAPGEGSDQQGDQPTPARLIPETVPMADPVRIQNFVAIGLITLLVVVMVVGIVMYSASKEPPKAPDVQVFVDMSNPFETTITGPSIASDVSIDAPIVYVIDCGNSMQRMLDMAAAITRVSIRSLQKDEKFTVIMALDHAEDAEAGDKPASGKSLPPGVEMLAGGYINGSREGEKRAKVFIEELHESGRAGQGRVDVVPAIKAALELEPKTLVIYTRKELLGAEAIIEAAKKRGTKVVTLALDADASVQESLSKVSKQTDAQSRAYGFLKLNDWSNEFFKNEYQNEE